jgi:2-polyprenyl-3-methyl-5-hydroxy-6-metoxy-1,4-benzoquinol methylase
MGLNLGERDARSLARHVVEHVRKAGATITQVGVHLQPEGFYFMATVNGRTVWARTGQGNFRYQDIAAELIGESLKAQASPWVAQDATAV